MIHAHSSTPSQRVRWVSEFLAQEGTYGVVSRLSRSHGVSRQTLYSWKAKGHSALEGVFAPRKAQREAGCSLERAVLTLLLEGHASYRGIQRCVECLLGEQVSLGTIAAIVQQAGERAQQWLGQHAPSSERALALDELYSSQRGEAYLSVVDVHSGAVWATTSPVAVDGESWTLLLWEMQGQGLRWKTLVSDGGKAIGEAVQTVAPTQLMQRDVWHVLHACQQVQGRVDRLLRRLEEQAKTVQRQAERLAQGKKPRGAHPVTDVAAHRAQVRHAHYVASSLRYLSSELGRLLEVVVLARHLPRTASYPVRAGERNSMPCWPYWQNWLSRHLKECNVISKRSGAISSWRSRICWCLPRAWRWCSSAPLSNWERGLWHSSAGRGSAGRS